MIQVMRKGISALFVFSAALFLFVGIEGKKLEKIISERTIFRPPSREFFDAYWSAGPETIAMLQRIDRTLSSPVSDIAGPIVTAGHVASTLFQATAENIRNLAVFITEQNGNIPIESALIQATAFWKYSIKYRVPLDLLVAMAHTESHFNPRARSGAGAAGVMQVMWRIHSGVLQANGILTEEELFDPDLGIAAGSLILSRYLRAHDDTQTALGRYYGGSASVYWGRVSRNLTKVRNANIIAPSDL
jgi:hypothetical protein